MDVILRTQKKEAFHLPFYGMTTYHKAVGVVVFIHGDHILALSNNTTASDARGRLLTHSEYW